MQCCRTMNTEAQWTQSLAARPDHQTSELKNNMSSSALLHKVRGIAASQAFSVDLRPASGNRVALGWKRHIPVLKKLFKDL